MSENSGTTGQDGSYLAEHLLGLGYEVHEIVCRVALEEPERRLGRIAHLLNRLVLHPASLESYPSIFQILSRVRFDECYHLAAQSFVAESFADGFSTMSTNIDGTHYTLAAIRELQPECRFYFAGSSEMFGKVRETPQRESTPFHPRSPMHLMLQEPPPDDYVVAMGETYSVGSDGLISAQRGAVNG